MRYFARISNWKPREHIRLYRLNIDNKAESITEDVFQKDGWEHDSDATIMGYLCIGEGDYDEITEEYARATFPEAFEKASKSIGKYQMTKAEGEKRYTLGAMYIPDQLDAHDEWTDSDELQRAVWDYVRTNDRRIRLQHDKEVIAGEWVEVMAFPYEITVPITSFSKIASNHTYPANTVFLGVIWEEWAWEKIKNGEILGYSIGGKAERLYVDMEKADGPTVSDVHVDTIMNPKKKKKVEDEAK